MSSSLPEMPLGIRPGSVPPFYLLDEYTFQDLCRDLFEEQETVSISDVYGVRGEHQSGIDLRAQRRDGDGIEVGQCKAYKDFEPAKIIAASEEFFNAWDQVWSKQRVRRFILFVAGSLDQVKRQQEIARQTERFRAHGILYEAWSGSTIRNRLGPHKRIVARYCKPEWYWVREICGEELAPTPLGAGGAQQPSPSVTLLMDQFDQLAARLTGEIRQRLDDMRERWRAGAQPEVRAWLNSVRTDRETWNRLAPDLKAAVLRFEASVELARPDSIAAAQDLVEQAAQLDQTGDDRTIRALILFHGRDLDGAFRQLDGEPTLGVINLRIAFLLAASRLRDAAAVLESAAEPNAETFRLSALLHVLQKDLPKARLQADKAFALAPNWSAVRYTSGLVDYYSAVSAAAVPDQLGGWPEPVDWILVRRDDDSIARLRRAAEIFALLISQETGLEDRRELEAWRIACLANDSERQEGARDYAQQLLDVTPDHFRAMAWVTARRLPIQISRGEALIQRAIKNGTTTVDAAAALIAINLATGRRERAALMVRQTKELFRSAAEERTWRILGAQSAAPSRRKLDPAVHAEDQITRIQHLAGLRANVSKRGGSRRLAEALHVAYDDTNEVRYLLERHQLLVQMGDWSQASDEVDELLVRVGTADAVRIAALATYNARRAARCIQILDADRRMFPGGRLPFELRELRALALQASGMLPEAIAEAEALVREQTTTAGRMHLARLYLAAGDLLSLVVEARRLANAPDLTADQAAWLAARVYQEDVRLAQELWRKAATSNTNESMVSALVGLAFQLGLDQEVAPLMVRLQELATQGRVNVKAVSLPELLKMNEQWRNQQQELVGGYRRAEIPIHIFASGRREPLSTFYHRLLEHNLKGADFLNQFPLLVRHGLRSSAGAPRIAAGGLRIHADITAVLLANFLGILDDVVRVLGPLYVAPELVPALIEMRERAAPHQPSHLASSREVLRLLDQGAGRTFAVPSADKEVPDLGLSGRGRDWDVALDAARSTAGFVVDFLPAMRLDDSGPVAVPEWAVELLVNARVVVDSLAHLAATTRAQAEQAISKLGQEAHILDNAPTLPRGAKLYCHANVAETLANAGVLDVACKAFEVMVDADEVARCRAEVAYYDELEGENLWLAELVERVRRGIQDGTYRVLPEQARSETDGDESRESNLPTRTLTSLLGAGLNSRDALWVEDRYTSRFLQAGDGAPVIGVTEILEALRNGGAMDETRQYSVLMMLRSANVRFIPTTSSEILHHLREATLESGAVGDTPALRSLRRYMAACALQGQILRESVKQAEDWTADEGTFLLDNERAVINALLGLWKDETIEDHTRQARAERLLRGFHVDHHGLMAAAGIGRPDVTDQYRAAASMASMLAHTINMGADAGSHIRRHFFVWLYRRVLRPRFDADPTLVAATASILRNTIVALLDQSAPASTLEGDVARLLWQQLHDDLPPDLRQELGRDQELMDKLGMKTLQVVQIASWSFEADAFWRAVSTAMNGRPAVIEEVQGEGRIEVRPIDISGRRAVELYDEQHGIASRIGGDDLDLLVDAIDSREAALWRLADWFDTNKDTMADEVARIATSDDPVVRLQSARRWRDESATVYYRSLTADFSERGQLDLDKLRPPSVRGLMRRYRLVGGTSDSESVSFAALWRAASARLIVDEGLEEALHRAVSLPVPLPPPLIEEFASLSPKEQLRMVRRLLHDSSPISRLHLIHLVARSKISHRAVDHRLGRMIRWLLEDAGWEALSAFVAVLQWTNDDFYRWSDARALEPGLRLAMTWTHAHHLFAGLAGAGAPNEWIGSLFAGARGVSPEWFDRDDTVWHDIAHPHLMKEESLLLGGLAYALGPAAATVLDGASRSLLRTRLFPSGEPEASTAALTLLLDERQAGNRLGTFLGGARDAQLSILLGEDVGQQLGPDAIRAVVEDALRRADALLARGEAGADLRVAWVTLYATLRDLTPRENLRPLLNSVIGAVQPASLGLADPETALLAARVSSAIASSSDDEGLRAVVESQLIELAEALAKSTISDGTGSIVQAAVSLFETAIHFVARPGRPLAETVPAFVCLARRMVDVWPESVETLERVVLGLCEELPVGVTRSLWELLLALRIDSEPRARIEVSSRVEVGS